MSALQGQSPQTLAVAVAALLGAGVAAGLVSLSMFDDGMAATPASHALVLVDARALPVAVPAPRLAPRAAFMTADAADADPYVDTDPDAELYRAADGSIHDAADEIGRGIAPG